MTKPINGRDFLKAWDRALRTVTFEPPMTKVLLKNGPCDPRELEMNVTNDAKAVRVRPMPFTCYDVYAVVDRFIDHDTLTHATGEYLYTEGARPQVDAYRKRIAAFGTGRGFLVKRKRDMHAH